MKMEIKFKVDIKKVKQAFAMMGIDIPSDTEIKRKLSDVVVDMDLPDEEMQQAQLGFVLMAIGQAFTD